MILKMCLYYLAIIDANDNTCTYVDGPFDSYIEAVENKKFDATPDDLMVVSTIMDVELHG